MLKVILAEDHNIVRDGIKILLEKDHNIEVVGEASNGFEVLEILNAGIGADVILADINMPVMDGIILIKELKTSYPTVKIVMLSMLDNEEYVARAFKEGASGYLLKNISADEMVFSLKHVHAGGCYVCTELALRLLDKLISVPDISLDKRSEIDFSMREIEILYLISEGYTNMDISDKLFISKRTIEGYRQNLIDKTGSRNTAALIKYAVFNGIIK